MQNLWYVYHNIRLLDCTVSFWLWDWIDNKNTLHVMQYTHCIRNKRKQAKKSCSNFEASFPNEMSLDMSPPALIRDQSETFIGLGDPMQIRPSSPLKPVSELLVFHILKSTHTLTCSSPTPNASLQHGAGEVIRWIGSLEMESCSNPRRWWVGGGHCHVGEEFFTSPLLYPHSLVPIQKRHNICSYELSCKLMTMSHHSLLVLVSFWWE